nr:DegT/DnrJ/EryC1/StrS family aminotransferase [Parachlamydiaceae bacterium]
MLKNKYLPYAQQSISKDDIESVQQALSQTMITRGPLVEAFEKEVATYCGAQFAVAFDTGTAALMAAYSAAEVGLHD